jgi:hypothetical protein
MIVHLIDGTYELFRHFYGLRRFTKGVDRPYGAVVGVLQNGDTYLGVATDHVIESFRNLLWADYKTSAGIEPALLAQFHPLEEALAVWPAPSIVLSMVTSSEPSLFHFCAICQLFFATWGCCIVSADPSSGRAT